ncbi:MAG: M28 family peptidase [Chloroflexi bacterium]|nr:M28 family peptidase [Chloroflexota bacterium]
MVNHLKRLLLQFLAFLLLSLFFSLIPALLAVLGNTSSYAQALLNIWYGLLPPIALLLLAYLLYRNEANWLTFLGRAWMGVGTWFLLQLALESLTTVSPLLSLLSLPAKFAGGLLVRHPVGYVAYFSGWGLLSGIIVFLLGGLALYIFGYRLKSETYGRMTSNVNTKPAFVVSTIVLVFLLVAIPLSIYAISKPTTGNFVEGVAQPSEDEIYGHIKDVYDFGPRRPGSASYQDAAADLTAWLKSSAPPVTIESTTFDYWEERKWQLVIEPNGDNPTEMECYFWPYSGQTPPEGITAQLVYLGQGTEADFQAVDVKEKMALISLPPINIGWNELKLFSYMAYDPDNLAAGNSHPYPIGWILHSFNIYPRLEQAGAVGAVYILEDYPNMGPLTYYAPYDGQIRSVPSLYIREEDGEILKKRLQEGPLEINLVLDATISRGGGEAINIYTVLPGKSDRNFIISSHFDSPWPSGVEDSSGVGMVLALARYYAQVPPEERHRTMVFLFTGSHFVGEPSSDDFIERHKEGMLSDSLFYMCIEHIADNWPYSNYVEARGVFFKENPVAISLYAVLLQRYGLYGTLLFPTVTPLGVPTDAGPLSREGLPVVSYISGPVYLFDAADTLERVPRDQLVPLANLYIDFIENLNRYPDFMLRFNINTLARLLTAFVFSPLIAIGFVAQPRRKEDKI